MSALDSVGFRVERSAERLELLLVALLQLGLELDEPVDDASATHDVDLVEAELDPLWPD